MFEDLPARAVTDLVEGAIDEAGASPRRWAVMLVALLIAVLALLWVTRRSATDDIVLPPLDAGGPG